jgi:hypothetical protein
MKCARSDISKKIFEEKGSRALHLAPTEVKCDFIKSSIFVGVVFVCFNRVVIGIKMHQEATRPSPTWPRGGGVAVDFFARP